MEAGGQADADAALPALLPSTRELSLSQGQLALPSPGQPPTPEGLLQALRPFDAA